VPFEFEEPPDIDERIVTPRQLWLAVFLVVLTLYGLGVLVLINEIWKWIVS